VHRAKKIIRYSRVYESKNPYILTLAIPSTIALNVCSIKPRLETSKRTYCKNPAGPECV
jgi:hypothetical protein